MTGLYTARFGMTTKGRQWGKRKAKIDIRIPEDLKEEIKMAAVLEEISFTAWIEKTLRSGLKGATREPNERRG
jgi:predicted DNA binding CopG/RHH family protein